MAIAPFRYTGTIKTTYRIDVAAEQEGPWLTALTFVEDGFDTHGKAEREYEAKRFAHPGHYWRLVTITEHCERFGKGRVYE